MSKVTKLTQNPHSFPTHTNYSTSFRGNSLKYRGTDKNKLINKCNSENTNNFFASVTVFDIQNNSQILNIITFVCIRPQKLIYLMNKLNKS